MQALRGVDWAESVRDQLRHARVGPEAVAAAVRMADCLELDRLPAPSVIAGCCDAVHVYVGRGGRTDEGVMLSIRPGPGGIDVLAEPVCGGRREPGRRATGYQAIGLAREALASCRKPGPGGA